MKGSRLKKALLTSLLVVALVLVAGCGGGEEASTTGGTGGAAGGTGGAAGGAAPGGAPPAPVTTSTPNAELITNPAQFKPTAETPASFKKALAKKKPICIEFYQPTDPVTRDVAREIAPLKKDFKKQFLFFSYDVKNPAQSGVMSAQLEAGYEPYFVILDKDHFIVYRHSGYIDRRSVEQQLFSTLRR